MITRDKFSPTVFRDIVQSIPVGILAISFTGRVRCWNHAAESILGWAEGEVMGNLLPFELPSSSGDGEVEFETTRKDGTSVTLQVRNIPWHAADGEDIGRLLVIADISAHRAAQVAIQQLIEQESVARGRERENKRFRQLLDAAPDAIIEVDQEGKIVLLNKVTEDLFGYGRGELLGRPVEVLIPQDHRHRHQGHRDDYWANPSRRPMGGGLTLKGQRKDGSQFPVEISLSPVQFEDGFRVSAIIRDVTERHLVEEKLKAIQQAHTAELAAKNHELEIRNAEVERADRLKSEFLSGMSHELRTPLHTIIGFTELLEEELEGPLNEKQMRFIRHIHKDSQHLLALINDVLDLSKIESGRLELQRQVFPLLEALEETVSSLRPRAEAKSIEIAIDVPVTLELFADRLRFKQILYNLLSNAVKFTPDHGRVWVKAATQSAFAEVCVGDSGIGIAASEQETVFDKFYQVGQRQAGGHEGTGLGLAITRHLVHEHGGAIRLDSEPGLGCRFTFTIPSAASSAAST
jgi:PAS domain S-box-containing protein